MELRSDNPCCTARYTLSVALVIGAVPVTVAVLLDTAVAAGVEDLLLPRPRLLLKDDGDGSINSSAESVAIVVSLLERL